MKTAILGLGYNSHSFSDFSCFCLNQSWNRCHWQRWLGAWIQLARSDFHRNLTVYFPCLHELSIVAKIWIIKERMKITLSSLMEVYYFFTPLSSDNLLAPFFAFSTEDFFVFLSLFSFLSFVGGFLFLPEAVFSSSSSFLVLNFFNAFSSLSNFFYLSSGEGDVVLVVFFFLIF